jgi:ClpP class serine protease
MTPSAILPPPDPFFAMEPGAYASLLAKATPEAFRTYKEHRAAMARRVPPASEDPSYEVLDGVALIRFHGLVEKRESFYGWLWGDCASTEALVAAVQGAVTDDNVREWIVDVDSPGGSIYGVWDCARALAAAATIKPGTIFGGDLICSAAYWIGAALKLYVNATGFSCSIGVYTTHYDYTRMLEEFGIKGELFASGAYKGAGTLGVPLTEAQRADIQAQIDELAAEFFSWVSMKRGLSLETVKNTGGRALLPREAIAAGFVDGVTTLSDLVGSVRAQQPVIPDPAYVAPSCPPENDMGPTEARSEAREAETSGRAEGAPTTPRADVAHADAPKEAHTMSDKNTPDPKGQGAQGEEPDYAAMIAKLNERQDASDKRTAALEAENAELKAKLGATSSGVASITRDRELYALIATARGENGGPVKIAAGDKVTEDYIALTYDKVGADAASKLVEALPVLGKGKGSHLRGTAPTSPGAATPSGTRLAIDFVGAAPEAYRQDRMAIHQAAIEHLRTVGMPKNPVVSAYRNAVIETTRRQPANA